MKHTKAARLFAAAIIVMMLAGICVSSAYAEDAGAVAGAGDEAVLTAGDGNLVIDVVEEIPAEIIEEDEVPLAAMPAEQTFNIAHILLIVCAGALCAAGVVYLRSYEDRIFQLRLQVAEREHQARAEE